MISPYTTFDNSSVSKAMNPNVSAPFERNIAQTQSTDTDLPNRHKMGQSSRGVSMANHIQRRVLGHAGRGVADRYGSPRARLSEAKTALVAAMKCLGDVDDAIYSEADRLT